MFKKSGKARKSGERELTPIGLLMAERLLKVVFAFLLLMSLTRVSYAAWVVEQPTWEFHRIGNGLITLEVRFCGGIRSLISEEDKREFFMRGWNPEFLFRGTPVGQEQWLEWYERDGKKSAPVIERKEDSLTYRMETDYDYFKLVKVITLFPGKTYFRINYELSMKKPIHCNIFRVLYKILNVDTLAWPSRVGMKERIQTRDGRHFRPPHAADQPDFRAFQESRWIACQDGESKEGIAFLFPDLKAWGMFENSIALMSDAADGGYTIEFRNPLIYGGAAGGALMNENEGLQLGDEKYNFSLYILLFTGNAQEQAEKTLKEIGIIK